MRNIRELRDLPISQMTDEEIIKATLDRLKTVSVTLVYDDAENNKWVFLARYKKGGLAMCKALREAWEDKFGKFKSVNDEE